MSMPKAFKQGAGSIRDHEIHNPSLDSLISQDTADSSEFPKSSESSVQGVC